MSIYFDYFRGVRKLFIFLLFSVFQLQINFIFAQENQSRSEWNISDWQHEGERLLDSSIASQTSNPENSLIYLDSIAEIPFIENHSTGYGRFLFHKGESLNQLGDFHGALKIELEAFELFASMNDSLNQGRVYKQIGEIYHNMDLPVKAQSSFKKAILFYEGVENSESLLVSAYIGLGRALWKEQRYDTMRFVIRQGKAILDQQQNDSSMYATTLQWLGIGHHYQGSLDSAIYYYSISAEMAVAAGDDHVAGYSIQNLGWAALDMKDFETASKNFLESIELFEAVSERYSVIYGYRALAALEFKRSRLNKAIYYFEKGVADAKRYHLNNALREIYLEAAQTCYENRMYKESSNYYWLHDALRDEMMSDQTQQQMGDMEEKSLNRLQKRTDSLIFVNEKMQLEHQKKKQKQAAKSDALVRNLIIAFVGGILILALFFYRKLKGRFLLVEKQKILIEKKSGQLAEKNKEITDSINYSKRIQNTILPSNKRLTSNFKDHFVCYMPKDIVAGDFYWLAESDNLKIIAAADSTGHGVPGALVSMACSAALDRAVNVRKKKKPSDILEATRELLMASFQAEEADVKDGMDISLASFEEIDRNQYLLNFSGANNPIWIVRSNAHPPLSYKSSKVEQGENFHLLEIKGDKQPIGLYQNMTDFKNHQITLQRGDVVYLFTDGYPDQFGGPKGKKLKYKKLKNILLEQAQLSMSEMGKYLTLYIKEWMGEIEQIDDICVLGIRL
jgi:tetratricopeptide (TPR) repeat protein